MRRIVWHCSFRLAHSRTQADAEAFTGARHRERPNAAWLDATQAGLSNYLIPFFGVLIAAVVLRERLTTFMLLGGILVLASTLLVTVYEERQRGHANSKVLA